LRRRLYEKNIASSDALQAVSHIDILAFALSLGARVKRSGSEHVGPCPKCGGRDRFSVNVRKQVFYCRGCAVGGDVIDLARCILGVSFHEALDFIGAERERERASQVEIESDADARHEAFVHKQITTIVRDLVPIRGTPGERYFRFNRRIDTDAIADVLTRTDAIGWHPVVYFKQPGHPLHGQYLGCIVGVMTDPVSAKPTGSISRTYIDGDLRKLAPARSFGLGGGIVRLSPDEDVLGGLHIGEGIETCLAGAARWDMRPIWACGSAAIMGKFPVLAGITSLTIISDHDEKGAGERAARETADRWLDQNREVRIIRPKTKGDLNDIAKRKGGP
jgi:hypothetical protein